MTTRAFIIAALLSAPASAAVTGKMILLGTGTGNCSSSPAGVIGTTGSFSSNGNTSCKTFDLDVTTRSDAPNASGDWLGLDFGAAVAISSYQLIPASSDSDSDRETKVIGGKIQGATTANFASPVDLDTIVSTNYLARGGTPAMTQGLANERTITGTYRYFRYLEPTSGYWNTAELRFIGDAGQITRGIPIAPVISPWGGRYVRGVATVTITSRTTSAAIYYTTDGTTPTNSNGTLYSGAFTLTVGASGTTLKAVAYETGLSVTLSDISSAYFVPWAYKPAEDWYDNNGVYIEAHGGGISGPFGGRYYWTGDFNNKGILSNDQQSYPGFWLYSSADLLNWRNEGQILDRTGFVQFYIERPHIIYNASTAKYVLWAHARGNTHRAGVATASVITGPWTWQNTDLDPDGLGFKDCNLFVEDDGTAYVVYTEGTQQDIIISRLASDYLSTSGSYVTILAGGQREAPSLFKRGSTYFLITSTSNYYNSTLTYDPKYATSTSATPLGTWSSNTALFASDPVSTAYNGQPSFVYKIPGRADGFIYGSDRWSVTANNLYTSRQVWLPLTFATSTSVRAGVPTSWDVNTFNGPVTTRALGTRIGGRPTR